MKKREFAAAVVLVLLAAVSVWNLKAADDLTEGLMISLERSRECSQALDMRGAEKHLGKALELWLKADGYTHIFIRHSEIDSTSDAFFEMKETLSGGDISASKAAYEKLMYHLESIDSMEHPSFGSIF